MRRRGVPRPLADHPPGLDHFTVMLIWLTTGGFNGTWAPSPTTAISS